MKHGPRSMMAAALAGAMVTGLLAVTTAVAQADHDPLRYVVTASPLRADGLDYDDSANGPAAAGSLWMVAPGDAPRHVTTDGAELVLPGGSPREFHAALLVGDDGSLMTLFLEARMLEDSFGGPYTRDCAGVDELLATTTGVAATCVDFAGSVLDHGGGTTYAFAGYDGFSGLDDVGVVPGFSPPMVTVVGGGGHDDDDEREAPEPKGWYVSASPFTVDGVEYADSVEEDRDDGHDGSASSATRGANWLVPAEGMRPQFVTTDDTPLGGFPIADTLYPIHVAIGRLDDGDRSWEATVFIDGSLFELVPGGPYPASCAGLIAIVGDGDDEEEDDDEGDDEFTCVDFKAGILEPPSEASAAAAQTAYAFTGLDGFEQGGAVSIASGFSSPRLTFGPYVGGTPSTPDPPGGSDAPEDPPGSDAEPDSVPTLPRTGRSTWLIATLGGALLLVGAVLRPIGRPRTVELDDRAGGGRHSPTASPSP